MRRSLIVDVVGDLGPGAQADAVGLGDAAVLEQRFRRRLLVGPDALLERAAQLRVVRFADQVVPLVVEGRVEEEALVLELEVLVLLADAALAQGEQLLTLGESADRYSPFLESDRHLKSVPAKIRVIRSRGWASECRPVEAVCARPEARILEEVQRNPNYETGHAISPESADSTCRDRRRPAFRSAGGRRARSSPAALLGQRLAVEEVAPGAPSPPPVAARAARGGGAR